MDTRITEVILGIFILIIILQFISSMFHSGETSSGERSGSVCQCYELIKDTSSYICYLPSGEKDTDDECIGDKVYNDK